MLRVWISICDNVAVKTPNFCEDRPSKKNQNFQRLVKILTPVTEQKKC